MSDLRLDLGWGPGQLGSGVAVGWVTGRLFSFASKAGRRLNVQSGLRKFPGKSASATLFERGRPCSSVVEKGVCGKRIGP